MKQSIHHFRSVNSAGCDGEILKHHELSPSVTVFAAVSFILLLKFFFFFWRSLAEFKFLKYMALEHWDSVNLSYRSYCRDHIMYDAEQVWPLIWFCKENFVVICFSSHHGSRFLFTPLKSYAKTYSVVFLHLHTDIYTTHKVSRLHPHKHSPELTWLRKWVTSGSRWPQVRRQISGTEHVHKYWPLGA